MPQFRIRYRLICEGEMVFDAETEKEACEMLASDYRALYEESDDDTLDIVEVEGEVEVDEDEDD